MRVGKIKWLASLFLLGTGVVVGLLFLPAPPATVEIPPTGHPLANHRPATSTPALASPAETPEAEFVQPRGRRKRLPDGGMETEADFFGEIRDWARKNPEAALAWAQRQPDSDDARKEALTDACFQIAQTDPQRAVTLAERFHLNRDAVLTNITQQWATKDLTAAYHWVADQPDGDSRDAMTKGVALIWSQTDPAAAAQFVVEQMSPGSAQDAALMMVIHQWAATDLVGAGRWAAQYPAGPLRERLLGELAQVGQHQRGVNR